MRRAGERRVKYLHKLDYHKGDLPSCRGSSAPTLPATTRKGQSNDAATVVLRTQLVENMNCSVGGGGGYFLVKDF